MKIDWKGIIGCLIITIFLFSFFYILIEKEKVEEIRNNEVVYSYYYLEDGSIHKTTYFLNNHSYTIDKPFNCNNITYYTTFESYLEKCVKSGGKE